MALAVSGPEPRLCFRVASAAGQTYHLAAVTVEARAAWVEALTAAIAAAGSATLSTLTSGGSGAGGPGCNGAAECDAYEGGLAPLPGRPPLRALMRGAGPSLALNCLEEQYARVESYLAAHSQALDPEQGEVLQGWRDTVADAASGGNPEAAAAGKAMLLCQVARGGALQAAAGAHLQDILLPG